MNIKQIRIINLKRGRIFRAELRRLSAQRAFDAKLAMAVKFYCDPKKRDN